MNYESSLRGFIDLLHATEGEGIATVDRAVQPVHELGSVVRKLEGVDDRTVLFNEVVGHDMPVVMNVLGTKARVAMALGLDRQTPPTETVVRFGEALRGHGTWELDVDGPVHEVRHEGQQIDVGRLPFGIHAAEQGGRYISSGVFTVRDPDSEAINGGIYRVMLHGPDTLTVSVDPGHDLGKVIAWGRENHEPVPFALVIGPDPAVLLASQAKVHISRDLYEVTSCLTGSTVKLVKCLTNSLPVPATAELVIEGHIAPGETAAEGPYGEFSYYYGSDPHATLCRVDAITHRHGAIYQDIHPVHTEHRNLWLHPGRELSLLDKLRSQVPDVVGARIPDDGGGMLCVISIRKRHNGDARRALLIAMGSDMFIKHAVVVDDDIDINDPVKVQWALMTRFQPHRDTVVVPGVRGYAEDPSGYYEGDESTGRLTSKIGYDATFPVGVPVPTPADVYPEPYGDLDPSQYVADFGAQTP